MPVKAIDSDPPSLPGLAPFVACYLILGAVLLSSRLLSVLHAESSAVVAGAAFFIAGMHVIGTGSYPRPDGRLLRVHLLLLAIPWLFLTASLLWVPNCAYATGLVLYLSFAVPSVVLGYALACAIGSRVLRWRRTLFVSSGLAIAVGGTLYDLGLHPQFFVLNHVFGAVLGPVYEDALYVRPGLFAFRALSLLWALILLTIAARSEDVPTAKPFLARRRGSVLGISGVCIGLIYLFAPQLGINTPEWYLQRSLGGKLQTEHFDLYFDPETLTTDELRTIADDHEYRFAWLRRRLGTMPSRRIRSYLYPTVAEKLRLTGAGLTDVSPVWLGEPQMHLLRASIPETMGHELVHVFTRDFGLPVIRASWLVGLVEGLAVALEPPDGHPSPHEQVSVALQRAAHADVGVSADAAGEVVDLMSAASFWSARGSVSYTVAGSFVGYLLDRYGAARIREVYAKGDFRQVYGKSLDVLAREWSAYVRAIPFVSIASDDLVMRRFTVPSLFEMDCPHHQPKHAALYRKALDHLALSDTVGAEAALEASLAAQPTFVHALARWASIRLARGDHHSVLARLRDVSDPLSSAALAVFRGDALALAGDSVNALRQYQAALARLPLDERDARMMVLGRAIGNGSSQVAAAFHGIAGLAGPDESPAVRAGRQIGMALQSAEEGALGAASEAMARWEVPEQVEASPAERAFMQRMASAWAGVWASRSGELEASRRLLEDALAAARFVGDPGHAAALADQLEKTAWRATAPRDLTMALFDAASVSGRPENVEAACL